MKANFNMGGVEGGGSAVITQPPTASAGTKAFIPLSNDKRKAPRCRGATCLDVRDNIARICDGSVTELLLMRSREERFSVEWFSGRQDKWREGRWCHPNP